MKHKSYFPPGLASTHTCSCADRPRSRSSWEAMAGTAWCRERPAPEKLSVLLKPSRTERGGARGRRGLNGAGGGGGCQRDSSGSTEGAEKTESTARAVVRSPTPAKPGGCEREARGNKALTLSVWMPSICLGKQRRDVVLNWPLPFADALTLQKPRSPDQRRVSQPQPQPVLGVCPPGRPPCGHPGHGPREHQHRHSGC